MNWSNPDAEFYERVHDFLKNETEKINAFGIEWLRERIHYKQKHDRRLETALAMMDRWAVIEGTIQPLKIKVLNELPEHLKDKLSLADKLKRDQSKLLTMLQYVKHQGDRKQYIHDYFGIS